MKKSALLICLCSVVLCGCASHYAIILNSGSRIDAKTKPKLVGNSYVFKDMQGRDSYIPAGRVAEIAPASMVKDPNAKFKPASK